MLIPLCDKKCGGNASQICGGSCTISVYKTIMQYVATNPLSTNYIGCLPINSVGVGLENGLNLNMVQSLTSNNKFPLTSHLYTTSSGFYLVYPNSNCLKIEICIAICLEFGFKYAGCGDK
jgi:hypothetical protein